MYEIEGMSCYALREAGHLRLSLLTASLPAPQHTMAGITSRGRGFQKPRDSTAGLSETDAAMGCRRDSTASLCETDAAVGCTRSLNAAAYKLLRYMSRTTATLCETDAAVGCTHSLTAVADERLKSVPVELMLRSVGLMPQYVVRTH